MRTSVSTRQGVTVSAALIASTMPRLGFDECLCTVHTFLPYLSFPKLCKIGSLHATGLKAALAQRGTADRRAVTAHSAQAKQHLFAFGIISDVQYANIPDGASFTKVPRYYRAALTNLRAAVAAWRDETVDFCIHLGDIVDGFNPPEAAESALDSVLAEFESLGRRHHHMIGNHCLYNFPRQVLNRRLQIEGPDGIAGPSYYSFCPHSSWRFVVLDSYEVSMLGWPPGHPLHEQARQILDERNPHEDKNDPTRPAHLPQTERRFVKFGGGASERQLAWLERELTVARAERQRVIVFGHLPMHPGTCIPTCLLWNYEAVLGIIHEFRDVCAATFAGHSHKDGEATDDDGIYHRVLRGVVETPPGEPCSGVVRVGEDRLELVGSGIASATLEFAPRGEGALPISEVDFRGRGTGLKD